LARSSILSNTHASGDAPPPWPERDGDEEENAVYAISAAVLVELLHGRERDAELAASPRLLTSTFRDAV